MGVAVNLLDAVAAKLNETTFGSATVERALIPKAVRKELGQLIQVCLQGKTSIEQDRTGDWIEDRVGCGLSYPLGSVADQEDGLNMAEDIQDWMLQTANRRITTVDGEFCLVPPFEMDNVFNPDQANEAGVMFCITNFNYRFYKDRT